MIDLCLLIVCFQETLPEEAAGHNPLLPAVPQQDETSPTSKVIFILSSSSSSSSSSTRDVSQRSNLMRGRKSNCCQPLHSSALMILPHSFMRRVNPCGNSYHQLQLLSFQLDVRWNMIACGKTRPSIEMTEHARQYLSGIKPRSLNL